MRILRSLLVAAAAVLAVQQDAGAYAFGVAPIRLDFHGSERAGGITVSNDDKIKLSFQVRLMRWSQDAAGEDVYKESRDLVYFPRLMSVEPQERRVVRVGTQAPAGEVEGTYRLIVEEMMPAAPDPSGTTIAVRMRFAIPIFVAPVQPVAKPVLEGLTVAGGRVRFRLRNAGNQHVKLETISLRRGDTVLQEAAGWYVLPGAQRSFGIAVPAGECRPGKVRLVLKGEGVELSQELVLDADRCRP